MKRHAAVASLMLGATSILVIGHDAGAVAGAPPLPNLNFTNAGVSGPGLPMIQQGFSPWAVNVFSVINQPGAGALSAPTVPSAVSAPAPVFSSDGIDADFARRGWAPAMVVKKIEPHSFVKETLEAFNHLPERLYGLNEQHDLINYRPDPVRALDSNGKPTWNGQGSLPNGFESPWHFAKTNFDPSFRTPYWNERDGFINDSFELGLAGTEGGRMIYNRGLIYAGQYRGKPDFKSNQPVWDGKDGDATADLFPKSSGGAAAAL